MKTLIIPRFIVQALPLGIRAISIILLLLIGIAEAKDEKDGAGQNAQPGDEFFCEASIFYTWKRLPKTEGAPGQNSSAAAAADAEAIKPQEVFFVRAGESGPEELFVKNLLASRLERIQGQALDQCRNAHESEAVCVSEHLRKIQKDYQILDFAARRALLTSITDDCRHHVGICLSTRTSDIACQKIASNSTGTTGGKAPKK